jgi:hypothetical protein
LSGRDRFLSALGGDGVAFAPIVWQELPALVHQNRDGWWRDPTVGQRLIGDAAALAGADAMFVYAAHEAVRAVAATGERGDAALDALSHSVEARRGVELVRALRAVALHGVIAAVPTPCTLQRVLSGEELEAAEDAFTDLVSGSLEAGADAVAVTGDDPAEVRAGVERAARLGELFGRRVLAVCQGGGEAQAWDEQGTPLGMISSRGDWPAGASGVVITPGDVSAHWDAARLRAVGTARP